MDRRQGVALMARYTVSWPPSIEPYDVDTATAEVVCGNDFDDRSTTLLRATNGRYAALGRSRYRDEPSHIEDVGDSDRSAVWWMVTQGFTAEARERFGDELVDKACANADFYGVWRG